MIKKTSALVGLLAALVVPVSMAGSPVNISIPDNLVPTEGSEVRNPVTLEGTEFIADVNMTESMTYHGAEFVVGQWDEMVLGWYKDIELPFTFTLLGEEYTQLRVYRTGNVTLLPASYDESTVRQTDSLRTDGWTDVNNSFYQGLQYPSVFALSKNNTINENWGFKVDYEDQVVNNHIEGGLYSIARRPSCDLYRRISRS